MAHEQVDRFDRRVEFISVIILSLATVLTAWSGYQAWEWGGEQAMLYQQASAARITAAQRANEALLQENADVGLFTEYLAALSQRDQQAAGFLYEQFPAGLQVAVDAWQVTDPLNNPSAPLSPFVMAEYARPQAAEARQFEALAEQQVAQGNQADNISDRYVLLNVIFAMVLFFAGISGKFQWRVIDAVMLVLGIVVLVVGFWVLFSAPVH